MTDLGIIAAAPDDVSDAAINVSALIAGTPAELWRAWTDETVFGQWLTDARIDCALGGAFEIYFMPPEAPERGSEGCRVLSFVPERMLSFTRNGPPHLPAERPQHTFVVLFFTAVSGGTLVELNHRGWPASGLAGAGAWPEVFSYFEAAWPRVFDALRAAFPDS